VHQTPITSLQVLLETGVALVQPLRVLRGRFQITTRRICFLVDDHVDIDGSEDAPPGTSGTEDDHEWEVLDSVSLSAQRGEQVHDRAWSLASLVEVHSRRCAFFPLGYLAQSFEENGHCRALMTWVGIIFPSEKM
jgi:hypothetical protein